MSIQSKWLVSTYRSKDSDLSVTDLLKSDYQLWLKLHTDISSTSKEEVSVSLKSFLGSALHKAIEVQDEDGVIKEFSWIKKAPGTSELTIGGTADELRWRPSLNKWRLGDIKLKWEYSAKKFLGIGTKKNPNPPPEQEREKLQMSIYRWLFDPLFDIEDKGTIFLFVADKKGWAKEIPEFKEVWLNLKTKEQTEKYIENKLTVATKEEPPEVDCNTSWMCNYCEFTSVCPNVKSVHDEYEGEEF